MGISLADTNCVFSDESLESKDYLFVSCDYTKQVRKQILQLYGIPKACWTLEIGQMNSDGYSRDFNWLGVPTSILFGWREILDFSYS